MIVSLNGGLSLDYVYASLQLGNSDDELVLSNTTGTIDWIAWDNGVVFPDPTGASMSLSPRFLDATSNDDGASWCEASSSYGAGDLGTPGSSNDGC